MQRISRYQRDRGRYRDAKAGFLNPYHGMAPAVFADPNASAVHRGPGAGQSRSFSLAMRPNVVAEVSLAVPGPPARRPRRGCRSLREARADRSTGCCAGSGRGCDRLGWPGTLPVYRWSRLPAQWTCPSSQIGFLDRQSSGTGVAQSGDVGRSGLHITHRPNGTDAK